MNRALLAIAMLLTAATAQAGIPLINATCPGNLEVHADQGGPIQGGPIYINGKETRLKKFNDNYFEAKGEGVTLSLSINPDGTPSLSYTGKHGANGICSETKAGTATSAAPTARAEAACLAAVAKSTNVEQDQLQVVEVLTAEAGVGVTIAVPGADAPWSCLSSPEGKVQGASYSGSEGAL